MVELYSAGVQGVPNPVLPMGRIVAGHPMMFTQEKDWNTKQLKVNAQGQPKMSCYFGFAIPKGGETHWNQTPWGQLIWNEGATGFQRGEFNRPDFAWKIVDGDSPIPNKSGIAWNSKEGYPGHWVLNISSALAAPKCFKASQQMGALIECVSDKEIKCGDYGRVTISVKANCDANGMAQSPGVYLNPLAFCMDKEGQEIVGEGVPQGNAAMFGAASAPAPVQNATPAYQPPVNVQPNNTWSNPPPPSAPTPPPVQSIRMVVYNGQTVKVDDLLAGGWTEAQIQQHTTPAV